MPHPPGVPVNEIVIMEILQPIGDTYQLHQNSQPMNVSRGLEVLTNSKGFLSGFFLRKPTMVPFSINGETMRNGSGIEVTPINGRILSW